MQLKWKVENWVFMQTLIMNTSLFTSGTLTRTHFLWMGDCFDSILREQFFFCDSYTRRYSAYWEFMFAIFRKFKKLYIHFRKQNTDTVPQSVHSLYSFDYEVNFCTMKF